MPYRLKSGRTTIGVRQTLKAVQNGCVESVYIAKDAEEQVVEPLRKLCKSKGIEIVDIDSMRELGRICEIDVGAACAAVLK